jgi:hypothetical protein
MVGYRFPVRDAKSPPTFALGGLEPREDVEERER